MSDFLQMLWTQFWQIAVLAIAVRFCVRMIAKDRPHLAHAMWLLVLVKCITPPIWGHPLAVFSQLQMGWMSAEERTISSMASRDFADPDQRTVDPRELATPLIVERSGFAEASSEIAAPEFVNSAGDFDSASVSDDDAAISIVEPGEPVTTAAVGSSFYSSTSIVVFCLCLGAVFTLTLIVVRCGLCLRSIHRGRTTEFDEPLRERLQMLAKKLRLRRVPHIIVSDVLFGPAVLGVMRHTIVLPRCLLETGRSFLPERIFATGEPAQRSIEHKGLSEGAECTQIAASCEVLPGRQDLPKPLPGRQDLQFLDPILAHELLHIRRGDLRTGLLQAIVQSLWWFHPAVWFSNRWLSREAERCCDEQVIAELGCSPAQYARSLLSVIESKHQLQPIPVFPGMKPVEITTQRMERIMSLKTGLKKQTPLWCWLAVAALAIVVLPGAIAKPQSDEKVVAAQPKEMDLPQETKIADAPEVEVSTKTYIVGDLIERLAKEQNLSSDQARKSLLQIFESSVVPVHRNVQGVPAPPVNLPQPLPPADLSTKVIPMAGAVSSSATEITVLSSYVLDGDRMVVVQSAAGHATLQEYIDAVRQHGFTTFQVTAQYIMGPPEEINSLMEALQQEQPFPKAAEDKSVPKSSQSENQSPQSAAAFCVGTSGVVSIEEARKIEELARSKAGCLSIQCPKVSAIDGQVATIQTGETKPFIVGFKQNDEPMIRTVVEGLTLRVIPKVVDKGLFQLKSVACLEGASEQRLIATTGRVTETPKMFTLPAITERRLQTTVELRENQAFLQSGMITTEEGKSQAFLTVLEARLVAPEKVVMKEPFVETTIDASLISTLASDEGLGQTEATRIVKIMIDEAMNADRPLSVNATTIVANGESLIARHPQALAARLKNVVTQIREHGFAQSRLNVCIAVLPDEEATRLLRKHSMVTAEAEIIGNATYASRSAAAEPTSKLEFEALQFCNFTLREAWHFKNGIAALSNSTIFRCRQNLLVLNGEPTSIKSHLNPAITGLENLLPGELLEVTVLPRNRRLHQLSLKVHASELSGTWSCEVTDDQACIVRGLTRIRPTGEKDAVLFIVSAGAAGHHTESGPATEEKVVYPDDPYAARRDQNADNATQSSNDRTSVGDSANAIHLHEDFGWSSAIHPRTIVAYVNDRPITVIDIVPVADELCRFSQTRPIGNRHEALPMEKAIRNLAPEYLYYELLLQHCQAFATEEQQASLKRTCDEQFPDFKEQFKNHAKSKVKPKTDDELNAWLMNSQNGLTLDRLQRDFNRRHTAQGYVKILPKDSPLLEKQKILQHCRMLFDVAALHMTVVEYPIPELVKTDDPGQVVGHGHTSRRSIYLKELGSMLTSLERDSWQVHGGLGTMTIDDKNETVSICQTKLVHVKVATLLAELETEVTKRKNQLVVRKYKVADLVVRGSMGLNTLEASTSLPDNVDEGVSKQVPRKEPEHAFGPRVLNVSFQPLTELIKTTIHPESWNEKEGVIDAGLFAEDKGTPAEFLLSVRQTAAVHKEIESLLSAIRADQNQTVEISCCVMQIVTDSQIKGLEERASLHSLNDGKRWALLTKSRVDDLKKFLTDEKVEMLACPRILTPSGQAALIEVGTDSESAFNGFRLSANPHLIASSNVVRLSHSVTVGELAKDPQVAAHESLVGSGQTLLLVIEQPGKVDGQPDRFVVMLTPEHLTEEKVEATQPSEKQTEAGSKP